MEYDCESKPEAKTVKKEPDSEGGFPPVDKRVSTFFFNDSNNSVTIKKLLDCHVERTLHQLKLGILSQLSHTVSVLLF